MKGSEENFSWDGDCLSAAADFANRCKKLTETNPYGGSTLERVINDLMTELWDRGFSQTEIRTAFNSAVADMPRYAAGQERRGA